MLFKLLLLLSLCLSPLSAQIDIFPDTGGGSADTHTESTVAGLPGAPASGTVRIVTDGNAAGDCTTGGGSNRVLCEYTGSGWAPLGDGNSGGAPAFSSITTGSNTGATMTVGTGATITVSGSGVNNANQYKGNSVVAEADINAAIARDSEVTSEIATHAAVSDAHHTQGLTSVGDTDIDAAAVDGGLGGEIADGTVNANDLDLTDTYDWTNVHTINAIADREWSPVTFDLVIGDADEGQIGIGTSYVGQADDTISTTVLDDILVFYNNAPVLAENISFVFFGPSDLPRFVLSAEGSDLATYNPRSMVIGPAATIGNMDENILCSTNFTNLDCDTGATGADLGVQDDVEIGDDLFVLGDIITPTITTPTIAATSWTSANHAHAAVNSGGQIAIGNTTGDLAASRLDDGGAAATFALFSGAGGAASFRAIVEADISDLGAYLLLGGGVMTAEFTADDLGIEFTAGDAITDCSTFAATGGGIFYDDSEGVFKKCQDNVLSVLDTTGGAPATADISDVNVTQTELAELETIDATTISANQWATLGGIAETLTSAELNLLDGITVLSGSNTGDDDVPESGDFGNAADLESTGALSIDVVAAAEMADADHGDVSWSGGVATVESGTLTSELFADATGIEFEPGDALTDCSTFSATGGGIFFDDSEGVLKKCQDNVLSVLDTTGGTPTFADISTGTNVSATMTVGTGASIVASGSGAITATGVTANSVALGTDTTGNYAGSSSEGGAATTAAALSANPASTTGNYCADRNADGSCATQEDLDNLNGDIATAQIEALAVTAAKIAKAARRKTLIVEIFAPTTDNATGDGKAYIPVNSELDGHNLIAVEAWVVSTGTTGTLNIDLAICASTATGNACSGTVGDMLSTNLTVDSGENKSTTAAAAAVIDTAQDDLDTGEFIRIDVDAIHSGTAAKGGVVTLVVEPE